MTALSRRFLFTAAMFLLVGLLLGFTLLIRRELFGRWPEPLLVSAHAHLILVGAVLETIVGTALWLFPRPAKADDGGAMHIATAGWWFLTVGTLARAGAEAGSVWAAAGILRWTVVVGGAGQAIGLVLCLLALRGRVRPGLRTG